MTYSSFLFFYLFLILFTQSYYRNVLFWYLFTSRGVANSRSFQYINPTSYSLINKPHLFTILITWHGSIITIILFFILKYEYVGNTIWTIFFILQYLAYQYDNYVNRINDDIRNYQGNYISTVFNSMGGN